MKALMFGWEFPPHILGGLGTASYGLTRGMSSAPSVAAVISLLDTLKKYEREEAAAKAAAEAQEKEAQQ